MDSLLLLNVSPLQIINLWDELHAAKNGTNGYGGDVMEFYLHRLMPHSPLLGNNPESVFLKDEIEAGKRILIALCKAFEDRHNVKITFVDGTSLDKLLETPTYIHRSHILVSKA